MSRMEVRNQHTAAVEHEGAINYKGESRHRSSLHSASIKPKFPFSTINDAFK